MVWGLFVGGVWSVWIVVITTILEMVRSCLVCVVDLTLRVVGGGIIWSMIMDGIGMVLIVVVTCDKCLLGNEVEANAARGCLHVAIIGARVLG